MPRGRQVDLVQIALDNSINPDIVSDQVPLPTAPMAVGRWDVEVVPAGSANGTPIGVMPATSVGVKFYFSTGDSVTYVILTTAPLAPPAVSIVASEANAGAFHYEELGGDARIYILARSGSPRFRFI